MAEDVAHRHPGLQPEVVAALALLDIERRLQRAGKELDTFHLPAVHDEHRRLAGELELAAEVRHLPILLQEELDFDVAQLRDAAAERLATLLPSQRQLFETVLQAVREQRPLAIFVDAPGGTGKTYTFNTILTAVRSERRVALAVAFSGIAATLLDGGRTFHSRFRAPLAADANSTLAISAQSPLADLLRRTELIICDEAPMAHRFLLEALDRSLRDLTQRAQPFGGKVVLLGGDFRQTLPVVPRGSRAQIVGACIRRSPLWRHFVMLRLHENMRARQAAGEHQDRQEAFADWLVQLGSGQLPEVEEGVIQLPEELVMPDDLAGVVDWVFGDMAQHHHDGAYMSSRAVLAPTNKSIDRINDHAIRLFPGEPTVCLSADSTVDEAQALNIPAEYLNTLSAPGCPPHRLLLKPGMPVMLLRNISPTEGLCNGTRLVVNRIISPRLMEATIALGSAAGRRVLIPRLTLRPTNNQFPFEWERRQFPIRPSFAITINKAQGQTLQRVAVLLDEPVFGHGQLYVAASRVGNITQLRFALPEINAGRTTNVVYREVL